MSHTYLREDEDINYFYENYKKFEVTFPLVEDQIRNAGKDRIAIDFESVESILSRQFHIAKDSLYLAEHSVTQSTLSIDSEDKLRYIYKSSQAELSKIRFMLEQLYDYYHFYNYAIGKQS